MMDDLQQAYAAYQNALINLRNPKVCKPQLAHSVGQLLTAHHIGAEALVRDWYIVRPLRFLGPCRGSILPGDADGAGLREGQ